jgi:hypothetical protein
MADAQDIVVCAGVSDGAARLFHALRAEGITQVASRIPAGRGCITLRGRPG